MDEFLFAFHNNYGPISYHFRGKARYLSNVVIFFHTASSFDAPIKVGGGASDDGRNF